MGLLVLSLCGIAVGLLTWGCIRKAERMGVGTSVALGWAGAFMGAFLSCAAANSAVSEMHMPGALGGMFGAIVVLAVTVRVFPRRAAV